jgi:protein TonB
VSGAEVFDVAMLDQVPVPRFQVAPQFPLEMRRTGTPGDVLVDFIVDARGEVQNAFALRSTHREFEAAAVQAVSKWKFRPGRKNGRSVASHLQVPIVFRLNDS